MKRLTQLTATLILAAPGAALAVPIEGEVAFGGGFAVTGGTGLGDATGVSFAGSIEVDNATGTFAAVGIADGDAVIINDFAFNPFLGPVDPLWIIGDFSFTLESVQIVLQHPSFLLLSGAGFASASGFDDTSGTWNLSANTAGGAVFNFSSTTAVPEPGTLALLGTGLLGIGLASRRRKRV